MKNIFIVLSISAAVVAVPCGFLYAQGQELIVLEAPSAGNKPTARDAILQILQPEKLFNTLQQYVKVPLPGTGVREVEVDPEKVSELNVQITKETGVDLLKFFQFIGKIFVIVLEGIARIIRQLIDGI
ncbi:MAG: hypothetical protein HYW90_01775 [Candidatus Sungbacteria bacterium]|nr:hypothetical protein [Candidatus Sungbacteria bacterium]